MDRWRYRSSWRGEANPVFKEGKAGIWADGFFRGFCCNFALEFWALGRCMAVWHYDN